MKVSGLPSELGALNELLTRLQRRGIAVTPLEVGRLLAVPGALDGSRDDGLEQGRLPALLTALLCKDPQQRAALAREYRAWAAEHETAGSTGADGDHSGDTGERPDSAGPAGNDLLLAGPGGAQAWTRRPSGRRRLRGTLSARRKGLMIGAVLVVLGAVGWWALTRPPPTPPPPWVAPSGPATVTDELCPQALPSEPVKEVWAWVPVADNRPWLVLVGGLLLLLVAGAVYRLNTAARSWLPRHDPEPGADSAPRHGLPCYPVHGDLLLAPAQRREMVWVIDRYVSQQPDPALDPEATVAATARAAGEPRLIQRRRTFPRQVWLWCDRKTRQPELLDRLLLETRRALAGAGLPVRIAWFHGLPGRLVWEHNREPFTPACQEGAGAEAVVAVLSDGAALLQAWRAGGERARLDALVRELRAWPRLLLVDLGDGDLTRLAAERLLGRLAGSQSLDTHGRPQGDGYLIRALDFWQDRLQTGLQALPEDDGAARTRVRITLASLQLWRDPGQAANALAAIAGERNRRLIGQALAAIDPGPGAAAGGGRRGPTWDWARLPVAVRYRRRGLGLGGDRFRLRLGVRHHLVLALLAGVGVAALGWAVVRLAMPHRDLTGSFAEPRFTDRVLSIPGAGRRWLGSPWRMTPLASLGPLDTPHRWVWRATENPERRDLHAVLLAAGTRAFPIRPCSTGWPRRSLAAIAAEPDDPAARQLVIRLLDRGSAVRVLIAPDWPNCLDALTQGLRVPAARTDQGTRGGEQLLVFLPPPTAGAQAGQAAVDNAQADHSTAEHSVIEQAAIKDAGAIRLAARFDAVAEVRGDPKALAEALDFPGVRAPADTWPAAGQRRPGDGDRRLWRHLGAGLRRDLFDGIARVGGRLSGRLGQGLG